ncbi:MAG: cob(I)yrinic acid a,c-diamide adenosyltransferase [Parcubacteria group bacterium]|nr:cob(I)yrinic acid a,c-diamide adenosyltransferase [Parcubacteria group bacterium]
MLYTRTGDDGKTRLFGTKRRVSKLSCDIEALGALDELNSSIGICYALVKNDRRKYEIIRKYEKRKGKSNKNLTNVLLELLHHLFVVQAEVAGADKTLTKKQVAFLEEVTDTIEKIIPPIRSFTLPGATILSAHLDRARTLARRAERRVRGLSKKRIPSSDTLHYLNRLSSILFALARFAAWKAGKKEEKPHYIR